MHNINLKIGGLLTLQVVVQPLLCAKPDVRGSPGGFTRLCWQQRAAVARWGRMGLNTPGTKAHA